ncbi:unnamed protein product [Cuscuta europaea]|uniref:Pathogenesis-related homeodomain protein n=1 Tax=Cuscuta europaea TaxID=41803 RepID=A0A9P0ZPN6_CUSEU|nr:unnamed protein product [Cuscuta europaea]
MVIENLHEGKGKCSSMGRKLRGTPSNKTRPPQQKSALTGKIRKFQLVDCKKHEKTEDIATGSGRLKKRKRAKRRKHNAEHDEVSRLQRRSRYLLIKMKLEQNLIDAYSTEGWKGHSREKIKPEKELERAKLQILKCKLEIREAVRQLDLLRSPGHIANEVIAPDGSVHHEHIICAKCKLRDAFPDNDIILCDGPCNCAFHQKCLDPPLSTENIPPEDEGWFCNLCKIRMEIIEATNAHLGTHFAMDSNWEDIFKEEAALPKDDGNSSLYHEHDWPSDDSEDDDYDPEKIENSSSKSTNNQESGVSDDGSSSSSLGSLEDEPFPLCGRQQKRIRFRNQSVEVVGRLDSNEMTDCKVINIPRQRTTVDYIKLNDELFGKNPPVNEQNSEDEDWGPKRKHMKREFESDAANTLMTLCENENESRSPKVAKQLSKTTERSIFRIPPNAVEKLRLVFAENELPSRAQKQNLSKQLGLDSEKVNKWFKNARYFALKGRKFEKANPSKVVSPIASGQCPANTGEGKTTKEFASQGVTAEFTVQVPKNLKRTHRRNSANKLICKSKRVQLRKALRHQEGNCKATVYYGEDPLKLPRELVKAKRGLCWQRKDGELEAEAEMERLYKIKEKVERLQQLVVSGIYSVNKRESCPPSFMYVPVAELKEKG